LEAISAQVSSAPRQKTSHSHLSLQSPLSAQLTPEASNHLGKALLTSSSERENGLDQHLDRLVTHPSESSEDESDGEQKECVRKFKALKAIREPERVGPLADLVLSEKFARLSLAVILVNTAFVWIVTDDQARSLTLVLPPSWKALEYAFLIYYTVEVLLKLWVHRLFFFWNVDWAWNAFDFVIVVLGWSEKIIQRVSSGHSLNVTFLRVFRLLRVTKILRIFKAFRFLTELRLMAACVMGSMISLLWATCFLFLMLMMASLVFVQSMANYRADLLENRNHSDLAEAREMERMTEDFGSVTSAMLVLFEATTGGMDWGDIYDIVRKTGTMNATFFLIYIIFFLFAFFNIITSIFVDKAMKLAQPDDEALMLERREEEAQTRDSLKELIESLDVDNSGTISVDELKAISKDVRVRHKFEMLGVTVRDASVFIQTLTSLVGSNTVDINSFVDGCMKMTGPASSLDVQTIRFQLEQVFKGVNDLKAQSLEHVVSQVGSPSSSRGFHLNP